MVRSIVSGATHPSVMALYFSEKPSEEDLAKRFGYEEDYYSGEALFHNQMSRTCIRHEQKFLNMSLLLMVINQLAKEHFMIFLFKFSFISYWNHVNLKIWICIWEHVFNVAIFCSYNYNQCRDHHHHTIRDESSFIYLNRITISPNNDPTQEMSVGGWGQSQRYGAPLMSLIHPQLQRSIHHYHFS